MKLKIKRLHPDATIPKYQTAGAACFDLHAAYLDQAQRKGRSAVFGTGLAIEVLEGHVLLIFSRSGDGFRYGKRLANCVGVIDSDYRGEIKVKITQDETVPTPDVHIGDRIAQAMLVPIPRVEFEVVDELSDTARGAGGFGSTGGK